MGTQGLPSCNIVTTSPPAFPATGASPLQPPTRAAPHRSQPQPPQNGGGTPPPPCIFQPSYSTPAIRAKFTTRCRTHTLTHTALQANPLSHATSFNCSNWCWRRCWPHSAHCLVLTALSATIHPTRRRSTYPARRCLLRSLPLLAGFCYDDHHGFEPPGAAAPDGADAAAGGRGVCSAATGGNKSQCAA